MFLPYFNFTITVANVPPVTIPAMIPGPIIGSAIKVSAFVPPQREPPNPNPNIAITNKKKLLSNWLFKSFRRTNLDTFK